MSRVSNLQPVDIRVVCFGCCLRAAGFVESGGFRSEKNTECIRNEGEPEGVEKAGKVGGLEKPHGEEQHLVWQPGRKSSVERRDLLDDWHATSSGERIPEPSHITRCD